MIINTVVTFSVLDALTKRVMHFKEKGGGLTCIFFLYVMISYAFYHIIDEIQKKTRECHSCKRNRKKWINNIDWVLNKFGLEVTASLLNSFHLSYTCRYR